MSDEFVIFLYIIELQNILYNYKLIQINLYYE